MIYVNVGSLPQRVQNERLTLELEAIGLTGIGMDEPRDKDGKISYPGELVISFDNAPLASVSQVTGIAQAHTATVAELAEFDSRAKRHAIPRDEVLKALTDPAGIDVGLEKLRTLLT